MSKFLVLGALVLLPSTAHAAGGHGDSFAPVALALAVILLVAKLGGHAAVRMGQPAVLGELLAGVLIGNLGLAGFHGLDFIATDSSVDLLAQIGVLVLLFDVGLESTVPQMLRVGTSAVLVATLGVVAPFALGWGVGAWLLPDQSVFVHAFLGATLCATSVGITARVLQDLGRSKTPEARIILGAAVVDDVLGLVVLAVVSGAIQATDRGESMSIGPASLVLVKAAAFLFVALAVGVAWSPRLFQIASKLQARGVLLGVGLAFCFFLAWLSHIVGLAPIVGAFAAGLILEEVHYRGFTDRGEHGLEELVKPVTDFLVPVFFVVMGARTDLRALLEPGSLGLAAALTLAAILGKQVCGLGVVGRGIDRLSIGIGMVPRGEVGLIFANVGLTLTLGGAAVISPSTYSAVVVMVIATTLLAPPALKWSFGRRPVDP